MLRLRPTHWLALVLGLTFALYAPSLANGYAFDDRFVAMAVRDDGQPNPLVQTLQPLWVYFSTNYWAGVYPSDVLFRPVTTLSVALLHAGFGQHASSEFGQALPQHAANVGLHVLATWLAYRLARRAGLRRSGGVLTALAFGCHAIHSEVVAGVVGRSELLAFVFGATAVLLESRRASLGRLVAAGAAAFLAFGSKESAVAWTGVLALFVLLRQHRRGEPWLGTTVRRTVVVAGPGLLAFLLLRAHTLAALPAAAPAAVGDGLAVRLTGTVGWAWGLAMSVLPVHLACDHGPAVFTPVTSPLDPRFLMALAALATLAGLTAAAWRRAPVAAAGGGLFLLTSVLVANVLFPIGVPFAERLYYTPSFGVCLALGAVLPHLRGSRRRLGAIGLTLWVGWCASLILRRNPVWADDAALFGHDYTNQPRSARIALNWAGVLRKAGRDAELLPVLQRVVDLDPHMAAAWNELGVRAMQAGQPDAALAHFQACLRAQRQDTDVHRIALENLVRVLVSRQQAAAAASTVEEFAAKEPATVARAFPALQEVLASQTSAAWVIALSQRLQAAAPAARPDWDRQLGLACFRRQAWADAARYLQAWRARAPDPHDRQQATLLLGNSLWRNGATAQARAVLHDLLASPDLAQDLAESARSLVQQIDRGR